MGYLWFGYMFRKLAVQETASFDDKPVKGSWTTIDETQLTKEQQNMLAAYRAASDSATAAKAAFEADVRTSNGFPVAAKKPKSAPKPAQSLAAWIVERKANGGAV